MKKNHVTTMILAMLLLFVTACSQDTAMYRATQDSIAVSELKADALKAQQEKKQEAAETLIETTPAWYLTTPSPDAGGMYAAGSGESDSMRIAMSKAKLRATFNLAKLYQKELSGSERDFQRDSGDGTVTVQYEQLIDELVKASIVGEQNIEQKVKSIDGRIHAWVLMKLPYDEFNKILKQKSAQAQDKVIRSAFDDLERRLDKRRKQAIEDAQVKQKMQLQELKTRNAMMLENQKASNIVSQSEKDTVAVKPTDEQLNP